MRILAALVCIAVALSLAAAAYAPRPGAVRPRRYALPARTMMFGGYFHRYPHGGGGFRHYVPRNYEPEGAMTAFAAGNTALAAGAGSYYGNGNGAGAVPDCSQCNGVNGVAPPAADEPALAPAPEVIPVNGEPLPDELPAADAPAYPGDEPEPAAPADAPATDAPPAFDAADPQEPEDAPAPPTNGNGNGHSNGNGKRKGSENGNGKKNGNGNGNGNGGKNRPRADDDYSDEEDEPALALPGKRGRGRGSGVYNTYFPMIFGGGFPGSGRSGAGAGETPGVATAIANSFSRGRGAVATSHATAYGGPHLLGGNGARKGASRRSNGNGNSNGYGNGNGNGNGYA